MKKYDSLDLMKFILSLLVVALHVQPIRGGYESLRLFCRLAVPLFFITSGFLFFKKICIVSIEEQNRALKTFLARGFRLYVSWMILLLPFTIYYRQWFRMGASQAIASFVINLFLGSTFIASWYLMALLIGTTIITIISRKLPNKAMFTMSFAVYLVCCAWSGYGKLIGLPVVSGWPQIYNSFPVSLIWLVIGKLIAEQEVRVPPRKCITLILTTVLYIGEYYFCIHFGIANNTDSLVTMIPICTVIFLIIIDSNITIGNGGLFLRQLSTVTYCLHASLGVAMGVVFRVLFKADMENGIWMAIRYLSTVAVCVIATIVIRILGKHVKVADWLY